MAFALLSFAGLAVTAFSTAVLVWPDVDALLGQNSLPDWYSASTGLAVGAVVWLGAWARLQRAAATDPLHERSTWERRLLLQAVTLVSGLCAIGATIIAFWQAVQYLLGATSGTSTIADAVKWRPHRGPSPAAGRLSRAGGPTGRPA